MDTYVFCITIIGIAIFSMAWMPQFTERTGLSYSVLYMMIGYLLFALMPDLLPNPLPQKNEVLTLHLTELIVIIALMGTGLKIERKFSLKAWSAPLKLITITMLLCIAAMTLLGYYVLGLSLASATLLGAVLAPTDPVLADDVQEAPPNETSRSETKFTLTSEAGLNDGVAFPFIWLAIAIGLMAVGKDMSLTKWLSYDLIYRIMAGLTIGYLFGRGIGFLLLGENYKPIHTRDGLVAIAATLAVYGITEIVHGYGFIAVFVCSVTLRHYEKDHEYHKELHFFTDQIERMLVCVLLVLFGGTLASGILEPLTWKMILYALVFIVIIRPAASFLGLIKEQLKLREKLAIGFFGIRGMGSIFYLAFGLSEFDFERKDELWAIVAFTILLSVTLHGVSANTVMKYLKKKGETHSDD